MATVSRFPLLNALICAFCVASLIHSSTSLGINPEPDLTEVVKAIPSVLPRPRLELSAERETSARVAVETASKLALRGEPAKAVSEPSTSEQDREPILSVLFVGNGYTSGHNLPHMVQQLAAASGKKAVVQFSTFKGAGLGDHLSKYRRHTAKKLDLRKWSHVVVQEQGVFPAVAHYRTVHTLPAVLRFKQLVRKFGGKLVLAQTWGRKNGLQTAEYAFSSYSDMQDALDTGFAELAQHSGADLSPVGRAWRAVLADQPNAPLWAADGHSPSLHGSYLAACVTYASLLRIPSSGNPYVPGGLSREDAKFYQKIADDVVLRS